MEEIKKVRLSEIRPSDLNGTIYDPPHEDRIHKLANDIKRVGLLEPLLVSVDGVIISGHTRYAALKYLQRAFVEVRVCPVRSNDPRFMELLIGANCQRVKTERESTREIIATVDPAEYIQKRRQLAHWEAVGLSPIEGVLKSSRALSDNNGDLVKAIVTILEANMEFLPMTLRRLHYLLLNAPPVISKKTGARYENREPHYKKLSEVTTKMRVSGAIPFSWFFDGTRVLNSNRGWLDVESYVQKELNDLFSNYFRDLLQSQPRYTAIVCEKETVGPLLNNIGNEWGVPVVYLKGGSSIDIRFRLLKDWERNGQKPIQLLILSDLDPAGYRIQNSFVGSLKADFHSILGSTEIQAFRVGITPEQVEKYGLASDMLAKDTDTNFNDFVAETGMTRAYEIDALPPRVFIAEVEAALKKVIDLDLFNEEVERYNRDITRIEAKRLEVFNALK